MVTITYQDRKGAECIHYPHTQPDLERRLVSLYRRHIRAVVSKDGRKIGAVDFDPRHYGRLTYWVEYDALPTQE